MPTSCPRADREASHSTEPGIVFLRKDEIARFALKARRGEREYHQPHH